MEEKWPLCILPGEPEGETYLYFSEELKQRKNRRFQKYEKRK
jgi:hypothetical protein